MTVKLEVSTNANNNLVSKVINNSNKVKEKIRVW